MQVPFLRQVTLRSDIELDADRFPQSLPFVSDLHLRFESPVTFFVGENGSGKSTLLEAIADLCDLPVSGGAKSDLTAEHGPDRSSELARSLRAAFTRRPRDGFFFRAELQAAFASLLDQRARDPEFRADPYAAYGGASLHARSHGEAFLAVIGNRFREGLFLLDEPESALSPTRQLTLLSLMNQLASSGAAQFVVATHSPILLTYPGASLISFDDGPLRSTSLEDTAHYQVTKGILSNPGTYWRHLGLDLS